MRARPGAEPGQLPGSLVRSRRCGSKQLPSAAQHMTVPAPRASVTSAGSAVYPSAARSAAPAAASVISQGVATSKGAEGGQATRRAAGPAAVTTAFARSSAAEGPVTARTTAFWPLRVRIVTRPSSVSTLATAGSGILRVRSRVRRTSSAGVMHTRRRHWAAFTSAPPARTSKGSRMSKLTGSAGPEATTTAGPAASSVSADAVTRRRADGRQAGAGGRQAGAGGGFLGASRAAKPSPFLAERRRYFRSGGVSSDMNMPKYPRHIYPEADDHTPAERGDQAGP